MNIAIIGDVHINKSLSSRTDDYLEACLNKLEQVLQSNDFVFCLGDFFHTPVVDTEIVSKIYTLLKQHPDTEVYTILGNHCCFNMNENTIYKTSLGLLELVGVINILKKGDIVELGEGLAFEAMPLNISDFKISDNDTVLLGHHFYNLNCQDSLDDEILDKYYPNRRAVMLGHDHMSYDMVNNVYRPGSLLRNAATDYNKKRKPFYYQTTLEEWKQGLPFRPVQLDCAEGKDIFVDNVVLKKRIKFLENVDRVIQLCSEKVDTETKYSMIETLKEIKTPERCFEYIMKSCKTLGVNIK